MRQVILFVIVLLLSTGSLAAQSAEGLHTHGHNHEAQQKIAFPDIPGYRTLTADLHMHTVFSDGAVWPSIRIQEAVREGVDVVAMTEHLEYQPHEDDIPHPDRNRSYEVATEAAKGDPLMVINGSEITRSMPPGHNNAVFVKDANKLLVDDAMEAFEEAGKQDAFIFWNHPAWTAHRKDGIARVEDMHLELIQRGLLHGIEVVNVETYSEEALNIALEHDLTILGTSDIHGLTDWEYEIAHGGHRTVTLVFVNREGKEGLKEALKQKRTVAWSNDNFIGRREFLDPLLEQSLQFDVAGYGGETSILGVRIHNPTHSRFILKNNGPYTFTDESRILTIEPNETHEIGIRTEGRKAEVPLSFEVLNAIYAPEQHPTLNVTLETGM